MANGPEQDGQGGEEREPSTGDPGVLSGRRMGAAALLLAGSVLLSRVMGLLREMVLAAEVGVGTQTDAYRAAFQIPDLLNYLLAGGALAIAFTPLYQRARNEEGAAAGAALYHTVISTLGVIVIILTFVLWMATPELTALQFSKFDPATQQLTSDLTRIVLPAQIFFVMGGISRAVLMAHGRFLAQAMAPLLYNGAIIVGGLVTGTVEGFAWGALVGAAVGTFAYPLFALQRLVPFRLVISPFDERFRAYLWLALPLMAGVSLSTVDEWFGRWFGGRLAEGTVASLGFARMIMMAPVAVIGQAAAAAALPTLAALHARGDSTGLDRALLRTLQLTLALAVLAAGALYLFAEPVVQALYSRGRFSADDVAKVSAILVVSAWAIPAWIAQQVGVRAFFARSDNWRPMFLGTFVLVAAIPLYLRLGRDMGAPGLALAGVMAMSFNAVATLVWARIRFGGPAAGPLLVTALRSVAVALAAGAAVWFLPPVELPGLAGPWSRLLIGGGVYGVVALLGVMVLGDAPMRQAISALSRGRLRP